MFNSIGKSSNFAQAGKAGADETVRAFAAARRNSTNFGELAQKAATLRSGEKIAAMKAAQHVAKAGVNAAASVKSNEVKIEGEQALRKGKRKAGALAAGGKLIASAGQYLDEPRKKRTIGSEDSWYDSQIKAQEEQLVKYSNLLNDSSNNSSSSTNTDIASTPSSGNNSGKVQALGSITEGTKTQPAGFQFTPEQTKAFDITGHYESDSSGGYNAFNTGGSRGGTVAHGSGDSSKSNIFGKPLTQMTIGEVRQLGNSGKIHATGRYQFTHNTGSFGEAVNFAGLSDSDAFSPENQNKMFLAFGKKYGTSRWVGLNKASSDEVRAVQSAFNNWNP